MFNEIYIFLSWNISWIIISSIMTSCLLQQSTFSNCQTLYHQVSSLGQFSPTSIKDMPITYNVNNRGLIGSDSYPSMCLQHWHYDWLNDLLITITVSLLLFFVLSLSFLFLLLHLVLFYLLKRRLQFYEEIWCWV